MIRSVGAKRLRILLGVLGAISSIVFADIYEPVQWYGYFIALAVGFIVPFALATGVAWVVEGFRAPP
jgi:hypothetical protein